MLKRIKNSLQYRLGLLNEHFAVKRQVKAALREKAASHRERSPGEVELYYWRKKDGTPNLGDELSVVVCEHYRREFGLSRQGKNPAPLYLYGIGSLLGFRCDDAVVWGTGTLGPNPLYKGYVKAAKLDIRAVRGPLTREFLRSAGKKCPQVYGDPAILMPRIYMPQNTRKKYACTLILHHTQNLPEDTKGMHILPITTEDYRTFIDELVASEKVVSSSLHGIILAESYGVPAVYLHQGEPEFKYRDYYYSTGRYDVVTAADLEQAMTVQPMPLPELEPLRDGLVAAFPKDIWEQE